MKKLFETASTEKGCYDGLLRNLQSEKIQIEKQIKSIADRVQSSCATIMTVVSKFYFAEECDTLLLQFNAGVAIETDVNKKRYGHSVLQNLGRLSSALTNPDPNQRIRVLASETIIIEPN
jgi:hypothetical protein